jgi:hypothetical protein
MLAMQVDTSDFDRKLRQLAELPDIIRKVVAASLSDTVDDLHTRQQMEMKQVFNNPTPYVMRGLKKRYPGGKYGQGVTKAGTYFEYFPVGKSPEDIVKPHVFGGGRQQKRSERRLSGLGFNPGGYTIMGSDYPKNSSGDISGARYTQMLHQLGALSEMARQAMPKNRQKNRGGTSYYVIRRGGTPIAIGERNGSNTRIMLVFARNVQYQKRYQYFEVGEKQVAYSLPTHFNRILQRYMSRM